MNEPVRIRRATAGDIDTLVDLRDAMWREVAGEMGVGDVSEALGHTREYFEHAVPNGEYVCLLAEAGGRVVSVGGMVLYRKPSQPLSPVGLEAYILNMLTVPEYRSRGLASDIVEQLLECAREAGAGLVWLRATDQGRPVYEKFGFAENPRYMQLKLDSKTTVRPSPAHGRPVRRGGGVGGEGL